jgi:hypothetical protein
MEELQFKDFQIDEKETLTAEKINEILTSYNDNILYLYQNYKKALYNLNNFKTTLYNTINWYSIEAAALALQNTSKYTISGYSTLDGGDIYQNKLFGTLYLPQSQIKSKIDKYISNGEEYANEANIIQISRLILDDENNIVSSDILNDTNIKQVIDNKSGIWTYTINDEVINNETIKWEYVEIIIKTSTQGINTNLIQIYPYCGSEIITIQTDNNTYNVNSKYPYELVTNEMSQYVKFRIKGTRNQENNGTIFSLRYIDIYYTIFSNTANFTFNIGTARSIKSITCNDNYIANEDLKIYNPLQFQIFDSGDPLGEPIYDSNRDSYPISLEVATNTTNDLIFKCTLNNINGYSPVVRWINIEKEEL